jgi:hypothetical protein
MDKIWYRRKDDKCGSYLVGYVLLRNGNMICIGRYRGQPADWGVWWDVSDIDIKKFRS